MQNYPQGITNIYLTFTMLDNLYKVIYVNHLDSSQSPYKESLARYLTGNKSEAQRS